MTPPWRGRSLFWTIAGLFLLTAVVGTLLQSLVAMAVLWPLEAREARARGELIVSGIASAIAVARRPPQGADLDTLLERARTLPGGRPALIVFRSHDGRLVFSPPEASRFLARRLEGKAKGAPGTRSRWGAPERLEVIARRPVVHGGAVLGEVQVVRPVRPRSGWPFLGSRTSLLSLPIAILGSVIAGLVMVRLLVRRLRAMEVLAARVAEGDLTVRIADPRGDEIGRLAEQLDRMTERLAEARVQLESTEAQRRQLFADITHELATPLTSIRGYAETLLDPQVPISSEERAHYLRGLQEEARRMDRLIRDLFELARLEARAAPLVKEPLDWTALCRNTVERFEPLFRKADLQLAWRESVSEAWIQADGQRIEQVLENLLVNALRYVPAGGSVELALGHAEPDGRFRLRVSDDGPGLPAEELPHVFERFYRGAGARGPHAARDQGGSGLGLAIVREIVEQHGGAVRAEPRRPRGLSIVIELPART